MQVFISELVNAKFLVKSLESRGDKKQSSDFSFIGSTFIYNGLKK